MTGKRLKTIPARLESFANYKKRAPGGNVFLPNDPGMRRYGANPYAGYDTSPTPFLFQGDLPKGINPMVWVIVVDGQARSLPLFRERAGAPKAFWCRPGRRGRTRPSIPGPPPRAATSATWSSGAPRAIQEDGKARDVVYDVTFAFVYNAFFPARKIHVN